MIFELMNMDSALGTVQVEDVGIIGGEVTLPWYIKDKGMFIKHRLSPSDRSAVDVLLVSEGAYNIMRYMMKTHAVSLTDTLWVRAQGDRTTWDDVSPYRNPIPAWISSKLLGARPGTSDRAEPRDMNLVSPDFTSMGSADKCWKRINGDNYLYKTCGVLRYANEGNRALAEVYAQQVIRKLGWERYAVKYNAKMFKDQDDEIAPVAVCKAFTDESIGSIEYAYVHEGHKDSIGRIIAKLRTLPGAFDILQRMLILDCIIMNTDRHFENFGFLIDNQTMSIKGMAPIYDNDISLGLGSEPTGNFEQDIQRSVRKGSRIPGGTWEEQASAVMTPELLEDVAKLRGFKFEPLGGECDLSPIRLEMMNYIVNRQVEALLKLGTN